MQTAMMLRHMGGETGDQPLALPLQQPLQPSPGHPLLPWQDMAALRTLQEQKLNGYGPVGEDRAHIPIDRAIDLLIQSGELNRSWKNPTTQPYQFETSPPPRVEPSVENRS